MTLAPTAPAAPGAWGQPVEPSAMLRYLDDLGRWRDARRSELDELDHAALAAPDAGGSAAVTGDVTLAMTLWQAVAVRSDEIARVWDSGRVAAAELAQLSTLVWGRLDTADGASLAVSLPEACRLSDAVTAQLRSRLALDPVDLGQAAHLRTLRASLERVRDLVADEPAGLARARATARVDRLDHRLGAVVDKAQRGADVGGLVGPLESEVALMERDLIVGAATRRDDGRDRERAEQLRTELADRADAVALLVAACVAAVSPAPVLGVPRVASLGPVPEEASAVAGYLERLADVGRALDRAEAVYRAPVAELADLRELLTAYRAKADATGLSARAEVAGMHALATAVVDQVPADLVRARAAVAAYRTLLDPPARGLT